MRALRPSSYVAAIISAPAFPAFTGHWPLATVPVRQAPRLGKIGQGGLIARRYFGSRYSRSTTKGPDTLVSGPFRACWNCIGHARGGRKSGRVQRAFPEIHHSPPLGFGAIDPAGTGGASSSRSINPTSM